MPTHSSDRWCPKETAVLKKMIQAIDAAAPAPKRKQATRKTADAQPAIDRSRTPDGSYYVQPPQGSGFTPAKQDLYDRQLREAGQAMRNRHAVR